MNATVRDILAALPSRLRSPYVFPSETGERERHRRPIVQGVHLIASKALEQPLLDHHPPSPARFLGGLKDHVHGSAKVLRCREVVRRRQQHDGVTVVAATVEIARRLRSIGEISMFLHRQRVELCA
jgi:hypothetical protein